MALWNPFLLVLRRSPPPYAKSDIPSTHTTHGGLDPSPQLIRTSHHALLGIVILVWQRRLTGTEVDDSKTSTLSMVILRIASFRYLSEICIHLWRRQYLNTVFKSLLSRIELTPPSTHTYHITLSHYHKLSLTAWQSTNHPVLRSIKEHIPTNNYLPPPANLLCRTNRPRQISQLLAPVYFIKAYLLHNHIPTSRTTIESR